MAVNTVFPKGLLTFECANGMTKEVGLFRLTSLQQAGVPGRVPAWPGFKAELPVTPSWPRAAPRALA